MRPHCPRHVRNLYLAAHYSSLPCGSLSNSAVGAAALCTTETDDSADVIWNYVRRLLFAMRELLARLGGGI